MSKTELLMNKEEKERDSRATTDDDDRSQDFLAETRRADRGGKGDRSLRWRKRWVTAEQ